MTSKLFIFDDESQTFYEEKVKDIFAEEIETKTGVYPLKDCKRYFDENNNAITYFYNMDLPAKIEAENLKKLRRSMAIGNILEFENKKPLDIMVLIPYLIILVLIIFG